MGPVAHGADKLNGTAHGVPAEAQSHLKLLEWPRCDRWREPKPCGAVGGRVVLMLPRGSGGAPQDVVRAGLRVGGKSLKTVRASQLLQIPAIASSRPQRTAWTLDRLNCSTHTRLMVTLCTCRGETCSDVITYPSLLYFI